MMIIYLYIAKKIENRLVIELAIIINMIVNYSIISLFSIISYYTRQKGYLKYYL